MKLLSKYTNSYNFKKGNAELKRSRNLFGKWSAIGLFLLIFTTSCEKFLDIQPEGELTNDQLLKDAGGFETAMYGVYASMGKNTLYGQNVSHNMLEVLGQYFVSPGNSYAENLLKYNYKFAAVESTLSGVWSNTYSNIANVNNVLKNLERLGPNKLQYYKLYKGEALGLRAFLHFDLLRMYTENIQLNAAASGIPYSTDFNLKAPAFIPLADVYTKLISDLTTAEQLLSVDQQYITFPKTKNNYNYLNDREIHFNLYAVQATLARVYLTKGDMANALLYAEKVIKSNKFQLLDKTAIANGVMKGVLYPKEVIFGLYSTNYFATVRDRFYLQTTFSAYDNRSDISTIYNNVQGGHDFRWDAFFKTPSTQLEKLRFVKLIDQYQLIDQEYLRPAGRIKGINLIRLPEMYYIAAEALLTTDPEKARDYFDLILKSRGLIGLKEQVPAVPLTLDLITADRFKEFIGEGQTFFNMKRLNSPVYTTDKQTIPASNAIYVFPIPVAEYDYRN
ncbi:SusD family protein [compost metagenome]